MRRWGTRGVAVAAVGCAVLLAGLSGDVLAGGATVPASCVGSLSTANALTTSSAGVVHGSECPDLIVVTSPEVREVVGGDGGDVIYANPNVEVVEGGAGDDVIYGDLPEASVSAAPVYQPLERHVIESAIATASLTEKHCEAGKSCYGGDGSQELIGSSGNDRIFGQRGNDVLKGNEGNDELFGGVGDEPTISGGAGNDLLSGGLGTDRVNGNEGSDLTRGDGTIDTIEDTGASGTDTLSFASAVTPGFHGEVSLPGFPADANSEERGVYVRLDGVEGLCGKDSEGNPLEACDNDARYGGGSDNVAVSGFERVIGSPYADYIVGSNGSDAIYGGGGADAIFGGEGGDTLYGGPDGDFLQGGPGADTADGEKGLNDCPEVENRLDCLGSEEKVVQRERGKIAVGLMVISPESPLNWSEIYLTGSTGNDHVKATYSGGVVTFSTEGESASFETSESGHSLGCAYEAAKVQCTLPAALDTIAVTGMSGDDTIALEGFPETSTPIVLGGEGNDVLSTGNGTEDVLVDGSGTGNDTLSSGNYDDALIDNEGNDSLEAGNGNDLLLSATICDGGGGAGDNLDGGSDGEAVNSASWAKLPVSEGSAGVVVNLESGRAGNEAGPKCSSGETVALAHIDDLEGSSGVDKLVGDGNANNLLGRLSNDELLGQAGKDNIESAEDNGGKDTVAGGAPTTSPGDVCRYDKAFDSIAGCETKNGV